MERADGSTRRIWWGRARGRSFYPTALALAAAGAAAWQLHLLLDRVLPRLSPLVTGEGRVFPLPVRMAITLFGGDATWLVVAVPVALCVAIWLGHFFRPDRPWGPNAVLTLVLGFLLLTQIAMLTLLYQLAELLPR